MATRRELVAEVVRYLEEHFPDATVVAKTDGLTANEVFTVTERATARHVEVTRRWLDGDEAGVPVTRAIREWGLAREIRRLDPNATLRLATTGLERVS